MLRKQTNTFPHETEENLKKQIILIERFVIHFPWSWIRNDQFLMKNLLCTMQLTVSDKLGLADKQVRVKHSFRNLRNTRKSFNILSKNKAEVE